jgi:hypothetical protein
MLTSLVVLALAVAGGSDDAFTMNTYRCDLGGWRVTTPAGWVQSPRAVDDPKSDVLINLTSTGVKGNVVMSWHKGATLVALKTKLDAEVKSDAKKVQRKPTVEKNRLRAEYEIDAQGVTGRNYVVAVAGPSPDVVVEVAVIGAGPLADYADLKRAVDTIANLVVFEAPVEKPWAHKKNVELLNGKLCSTKTSSFTFDGAGHLLVEPGDAKTWYDLVGDDAKVAMPGKKAVATEVACTASTRADDGHVLELSCGKTKWSADRCSGG